MSVSCCRPGRGDLRARAGGCGVGAGGQGQAAHGRGDGLRLRHRRTITGGATTTSARAWPTRSWTRSSNDGTFRVIERKKLDTVLAEQDFARSDRADPSAAKLAKVGKVLGVKYIIAGSITKFGGEEKNYGGGGRIKGSRRLGLEKAKTEVDADRAPRSTPPRAKILLVGQGRGRLQEGRRLQLRRGRRRRRCRLPWAPATSRPARSARRRKRPARRWSRRSWPRRTASSSRRTPGSTPGAAAARRPFFLSIIAVWPCRPSSPSPTSSPCSAWGWRRSWSCSCSQREMTWALGVFVVAGLTDLLDGLIARLGEQQTTLGRHARPGGGQDPAHLVLHRPHLGPGPARWTHPGLAHRGHALPRRDHHHQRGHREPDASGAGSSIRRCSAS